ncbi:MAG: hypothetical protein AAF997_03420 [Myxococcota bacterium]
MTETDSTPRDPLAFSSGWSLGEDAYQSIAKELRAQGVRTIVEFGSGTSTLRLSRDFPDVTIFSIESEARFRDETLADLDTLGGPAEVDLVLRPIEWQRHSVSWFRSYQPGGFPSEVDSVLIDGPPITTRRGREACLYQVFGSLRPGAKIFLDDYCRDAEQQIVRNWLRAYDGSLVQLPTIERDHRVAVLQKVGDAAVARARVSNTIDSALQNGRHLLGWARRAIRPRS